MLKVPLNPNHPTNLSKQPCLHDLRPSTPSCKCKFNWKILLLPALTTLYVILEFIPSGGRDVHPHFHVSSRPCVCWYSLYSVDAQTVWWWSTKVGTTHAGAHTVLTAIFPGKRDKHLQQTLMFLYGMIWPICAESAVKHLPTNQPTLS